MSSAATSRPGRGATLEGSRGFQPTEKRTPCFIRRGATFDVGGCATMRFKRRSATQHVRRTTNRGLKPPATVGPRSARRAVLRSGALLCEEAFDLQRCGVYRRSCVFCCVLRGDLPQSGI